MLKININEHCSFDKTIRGLFHKKQKINNSFDYTEEEKEKISKEIEKDIYIFWNNSRSDLNNNKT